MLVSIGKHSLLKQIIMMAPDTKKLILFVRVADVTHTNIIILTSNKPSKQ